MHYEEIFSPSRNNIEAKWKLKRELIGKEFYFKKYLKFPYTIFCNITSLCFNI